MCSAGGSWSAGTAAAWTPRRPCRTRWLACTSRPAGARRAATSPPSSATSTRSWWRRPSPPPPSRSSSSPPTTAPRRWRATCTPCTGPGWPCLPFHDPYKHDLKKKYNITAIPKLVIVKQTGEVITDKGRKQIRDKGLSCFRNWLEGADIFQNFSS
uniref:Nucleoredoxin like 2 n=1 Tax=Aquila chrysaetos chrysaetos TaxID=223781 RepID=A0A663EXY2_AQUCH